MLVLKPVKNILHILLFSFALFISTLTFAQPPDGDGGGDDSDTGVPIDGGISLLAAAGIAYGTKKIIDFQKQKKSNESEE